MLLVVTAFAVMGFQSQRSSFMGSQVRWSGQSASQRTLIFPQPGSCQRTCVRKEIHTLGQSEIQRFTQAVNQMYNDGLWSQLVQIHLDASQYAHWNSLFFPFHRAFIRVLEATIQTYYDPSFCMPYWDITREASSPFNSILWSNSFLGGNGSPTQNNCVRTGPFSHFRDASGNCLQRAFGGTNIPFQTSPNFGYFVDRATLNQIISQSPTYEYFRSIIELFPHQAIHNGISGSMRTMGSPLDPAFWVIHAFVDKIWMEYQTTRQSANPFSGATTNMYLPMQWVQVTPVGVLDPSQLCYNYAQSPPSNQQSSVGQFKPIPSDWLAMNGISPQEAAMWEQRFKNLLPTRVITGPSMIALEVSAPNSTQRQSIQQQ